MEELELIWPTVDLEAEYRAVIAECIADDCDCRGGSGCIGLVLACYESVEQGRRITIQR